MKGRICFMLLSVTISGVLSTYIRRSTVEEAEDVFEARPNLLTCPNATSDGIGQAICGDVFEFDRKLRGGGTRRERRHIQNCNCPNSGTCEYAPENMLRQSSIHQEVLCVPARSLPECRIGQTAKRMHLYADNFSGRTYSSVSCTCPRHFAASLRGRQKATRFNREMFRGFGRDHLYECVYPGTGRRSRRRQRQNRRRQRNRGNRIRQ